MRDGATYDYSILYPKAIRAEFVTMYYRDFMAFNYTIGVGGLS